MTTAPEIGLAQPITSGIVTALVGFTSSFTVVLAGLRAVGATPAQAGSGLLSLCLITAVGMMALSRWYRLPITLAWSTPGAALLAGAGVVVGGWPAAIGAFLATGVLIVATGLWQRLGRLVAAIPTELAQAMLAGVLLTLCLAPVTSLHTSPAAVIPVMVTWVVLQRFAKRWAAPAAFAAAGIVVAISLLVDTTGQRRLDVAAMVPAVHLTMPQWTWQAMVGIAVPLYIVTMASQNIPGTAVMATFGYHVPWRTSMTVTGIGTIVGAAAGGHAVNLAAIMAALSAGPTAHPDRDRRWIAAFVAGASFLVLALCSSALAVLVAAAPAGVLETVAGLALLPTLGAALSAALNSADHREAAVATFLVAASGVTLFGIGSAFWALLCGLLLRWVTNRQGREVSRWRRGGDRVG